MVVLGVNTLGETTLNFVRIRVVNPNNTWKEVIRNTNFKDSDNTDATWDVTNHDWEFTGVQTIQTKSIYLNSDTITNATLTIDTNNITDSSVLTFYLSADGGSNWETVTNRTRHNFTNTGDELRLKITSSGNSKIHIERGRFFPQTFPIILDDGSSQPIEVVYNEN